jgi:superfamily II DNA/RNA helicase
MSKGKVLIFANSKAGCEELCKSLMKESRLGVTAGSIHG